MRAINAAWGRAAGASREASLVGLHLRDLLGTAAYEALLAATARLEGFDPVSVETSGEAGCPRTLTCAPDLAPDGRLRGLVLVGEEPDEGAAGRELVELRERAEELTRLMDLLPVPVFVAYGARAERLTGNPAAYAALRMPTGANMSKSAPPGEVPQHYRTFLAGREVPPEELPVQYAAIHGTEVRDAEVQHVYDDGTTVDFFGSAAPLFDAAGRVRGVVAAFVDISERKRVEDALRESEQRFAAFMDNSPAPAYLKDADGRYVYVNPSCAEVFGRTPAEVIGKVDAELFSEEEARRILENDRAVRAAGGPTEFSEVTLQDGVLRRFRSIKFRIDAPGRSYLGGISVDITEQKRIEEEREQLLDAERAARAEAERANRMKDEFLATLSHELRTPLSAILGYAQMLRGGQIRPEGVARALEVIERNARVQSELVSDLLDMNRIISGKLQLDPVPADLAAIADAAVESIRQGAESKGLRLEVDVAPLPRPVIGDQARLQQVLWNLLSNAVKFTGRGGSVRLTVRPVGEAVEMCVADTGQGIGADFLPHVFDRFRQADSSASRQHGGLGLGLAICKRLVELHGGTIGAESPGPGRGATFTVRLPTGAMAEDAGGRSLPARRAAAEAGASLRGVKAVVVDDETDARELVRQLLEAQGMDVRAAASAEEALSAVEQVVPEVLISDIGMPHEDGYALIRKLRSLPPERGGRVPAVALTAFARPEDQARAREAGYQRHLAKPIDAGQLYSAIESLVAPARAG
ncbi:MAG: PAS domain-containing protein [Polyangiaceae bacterium]|nr:PAS domain-containing protein [Polyangiaceae bacterium]